MIIMLSIILALAIIGYLLGVWNSRALGWDAWIWPWVLVYSLRNWRQIK